MVPCCIVSIVYAASVMADLMVMVGLDFVRMQKQKQGAAMAKWREEMSAEEMAGKEVRRISTWHSGGSLPLDGGWRMADWDVHSMMYSYRNCHPTSLSL